jgi:DUF1365 family protein
MAAAIYRTRITHLRTAPARHYFAHRGYSWYIDVDRPPQLPRWLRPFARFDPTDHFNGGPGDSLRQRIDAFLTEHGAAVPDGRITALLQARVLGYVFNPVSFFWCHDSDGVLRHVVAEVHNTYAARHAYLLPPADTPVVAPKRLYVSPFNPVAGHYLIRAPRPGRRLDIIVSLHGSNAPLLVATLRGTRRQPTVAEIIRLQFISPLAPLMGALRIRIEGIVLWLRRVPVVPREDPPDTDSQCPRRQEGMSRP